MGGGYVGELFFLRCGWGFFFRRIHCDLLFFLHVRCFFLRHFFFFLRGDAHHAPPPLSPSRCLIHPQPNNRRVLILNADSSVFSTSNRGFPSINPPPSKKWAIEKKRKTATKKKTTTEKKRPHASNPKKKTEKKNAHPQTPECRTRVSHDNVR